MSDARRFSEDHPLAYRLAISLASLLFTFALSVAFIDIPGLSGAVLIQPAMALGPSLGLFLGWPAIVGCTLGTAAAEALQGYVPTLLALRALVYLICNALPYSVWYLIKRKNLRPYPRFDSTSKTALALILFTIDAFALALLLMPIETAVTTAMDINETRFLSSFVFLIYLGLPLLMIVERLGLTPLPPRFITIPYIKNRSMNLTQRILAYLLMAVVVAVILLIGIGTSPLFLSEENMGQTFAENIASTYVFVAGLTVFLFTPMLLVLHQLEQHFARPAEVLSQASRDFVNLVAAHGSNPENRLAASDVPTDGIKPRHEMADLFDSTNAMRHDLVSYIDQLGQAVAERERTATELSIAAHIQTDAVPQDFSELRGFFCLDIAAALKPAREVGGDFYDVFSLSAHEVGIVIADVSGKGMPAALFMMRAMAVIRDKMRACDDVGEALTQANRALCERNDTMFFVTVFACTLDISTGEMHYANAGHNSPWLMRSGTGTWLEAAQAQLVMGALEITRYRSHSLFLSPGDGIVCYTDGVTEAANAQNELFGNDRLENALIANSRESSSVRVAQLLSCVEAFAGEAPQADDITMLSAVWDLPMHHLEVEPSLEALAQVEAFIAPLCVGEGRSQKMAFDVRLAFEEIFVNIVRHGFDADTPKQPVIIDIAVCEQTQRLHARIADAGLPYDPLAYVPKRVEAERGVQNKVGGLGVLLVRTVVDSLAYGYENDMNVLRFCKEFV